MSDEHILGALPEDAAQALLDRALGRLDAAAAEATDLESFAAAAESIRQEARAAADEAAAGGESVSSSTEANEVAPEPAADPAPERPGSALEEAFDSVVDRVRGFFHRSGGAT